MKPEKHLVVMAREPRIGQVKTRLARDIGLVEAWRFYSNMLNQTTLNLRDARWTCWLSLTPDASVLKPNVWPRGWNRMDQGCGDLGARIMAPMLDLPPGPVVVVGSDIPAMRRQHIQAAFQSLGHADMVLGPADDGGFWLIGQRRRPRIINPFNDVRWSTEHALDDTLAGTFSDARHTRIKIIDTLWDVDNKADYDRWKREG